MQENTVQASIEAGQTSLGMELGSTRIKAVLTGPDHRPLATGGHDWASVHSEGVWTYGLDAVWSGVQAAYSELAHEVETRYGTQLTRIGSMGFSAMMHGYLAFDAEGDLLTPFRTWQNTMTSKASGKLTNLFAHNIPQRWSVAHLYQAILNGEEHVTSIDFLTTLAGYVHWRLTGERALGVGDASGMFPIDVTTSGYDEKMLEQFDSLLGGAYPWRLHELLPRPLTAGTPAGNLTGEGALLLDPTGRLQPGVPLAPPEGDAGTGMVATGAVAPRTANVSAGTSIFAMVVLEESLAKVHEEIDILTTPAGAPMAMAHCNNGALDLQAWVGLFGEAAAALGADVDTQTLFEVLYSRALEGDPDGGGMLAYNFLAGEHAIGLEAGRPLFVRHPGSAFTLANFLRTHLYAAFATLRSGLDILTQDEGVRIESLLAHGGLFKTRGVAQSFLAAALNVPVSVGDSAGEGGAWGMALLAAFLRSDGQDLTQWVADEVIARSSIETMQPEPSDVAGFNQYMARFLGGLPIQRAAIDTFGNA